MSVVVVTWVCFIFFHEMKRDLSSLTEKIDRRDAIHHKLEEAETLLIKATQRAWIKAGKPVLRPHGALGAATGGHQQSKSASQCRTQLRSVFDSRTPRVLNANRRDLEKRGNSVLEDYSGNRERHDEAWPWYNILSRNNRPSHRLPLLSSQWLPRVMPFSRKVDTIDWCREQLETLNSEIDLLLNSPEEHFPLVGSAFILFNTQIAAHMACQSEILHLPGQMTPRIVGFCPRSVIWANLGASYWASWFRSVTVYVILFVMISLWSIPVAWTGALSQIDQIESSRWQSFLGDARIFRTAAQAIAGLLPTVLLGVLLYLLPLFLELLAEFKGAKTHAIRDEFVQKFYFAFLFIQVFLVVSIASFFTTSIDELAANVEELGGAKDVLDILSRNLPKAANYFFSYMILQSLSASSATLLQVGAIITHYVLGPLLDTTARAKWLRHTSPISIRWSAVFPVYTNFACIALTYCIISPLISIFAILTFSLLWAAQRYMILYVYQFESGSTEHFRLSSIIYL
ncbi:phm7-similarity to hyp1 [Fusarium albosuccineum]|uniref:Phm7-similarity to hyp1 n=1 Tax=Fusarium albosuccineum TaxID=1237068 RepID=A0A8H4L949_9HYPO|nr:phm7-similarity to hyp1 [Fusarium albosuccineum]